MTERRLTTTAGGGDPGTADVRAVEPERMEVAVAAARPALLVTSDVFLPGWRARVDGREVPVERVDYLLRGVVVPAGRHVVEFDLPARGAGPPAGS